MTYTVLGLIILEQYGIDFTSEDVGDAWVKLLPMACTAEHVALENLKKGMKPPKTALKGNPFMEWIGADIRSDPWGYAAPGLPEVAADFAYRDASVSHIMNGTYGEMFFSAAIAAAFVTDDPIECLQIGLTEIPAKCRLTETVKETLRWCRQDGDWEATVKRIEKKYAGMSGAHTLQQRGAHCRRPSLRRGRLREDHCIHGHGRRRYRLHRRDRRLDRGRDPRRKEAPEEVGRPVRRHPDHIHPRPREGEHLGPGTQVLCDRQKVRSKHA